MHILEYHFDEKSKDLQNLAESLHKRFCVSNYLNNGGEGDDFLASSHVGNILRKRSHSPNVQAGLIFGVQESYEVVNASSDPLRLVSVGAEPSYSVSLWVNDVGAIRAYIFLDDPAIAKARTNSP